MRGKVKVIITNDQNEVKIPTGVRMLVRLYRGTDP